jgi:hypothetical protein
VSLWPVWIGGCLVGITCFLTCFLPSAVRVGGVAARQAAPRAARLRGAALIGLATALDQPAAEAVIYARAYVDAETILTALVLNLRDTASGRAEAVSPGLFRPANAVHGNYRTAVA